MVALSFRFTMIVKHYSTRYSDWCLKYPFKSSVCNALTIMTTGDCLMQMYEISLRNNEQTFDLKRSFIVSSYAVLFQGPIYCAWYCFILPRLAPIQATRNRWLLNQ